MYCSLFQLLISLVFLIGNEKSEEIQYFDIIKDDKLIGELKTVKMQSDGSTLYKSYTQINTKIVKDVAILYQFEVNMSANEFTASDAKIKVNGKVHKHTVITKVNNQYRVQENEKKERWISEPIAYPAVLFLFQEPVGVKNALSEETGEFHALSSLGNHTYKKVNPKGKENIYYYQNGKLQSASIDAGIVNFEIKLRK